MLNEIKYSILALFKPTIEDLHRIKKIIAKVVENEKDKTLKGLATALDEVLEREVSSGRVDLPYKTKVRLLNFLEGSFKKLTLQRKEETKEIFMELSEIFLVLSDYKDSKLSKITSLIKEQNVLA